MKRIATVFLALALAPTTAVLAVDADADIGGAVGDGVGAAIGSEMGEEGSALVAGAAGTPVSTAVMTDDGDESSFPRSRSIMVKPSPRPDKVYAELPPPPRIIDLQQPPHRRTSPDHAKH